MKQAFIEAYTRREAEKEAAWAAVIVKVDGGYRAFESQADYRTWKNQNRTWKNQK